jgi:hypothetical protein
LFLKNEETINQGQKINEVNAEKNRKTAQKAIEKKKTEEKEKLTLDSLRSEEIKLKIKTNTSLNANTKSDTIYEMNEEDAKAVFNEQLSKEDKTKLAEVLEVPYGAPGRLPNTTIAAALRDEGLDVGDSAVTKHRRGACRCFGSNPKISA